MEPSEARDGYKARWPIPRADTVKRRRWASTRIGLFINTPAQVHLYKNVIRELELRGHEVTTLARDYGDTIPLLDELGIRYVRSSKPPVSRLGKMATFPSDVARSYALLKEDPPDLVLDAGIFGTYTAALLRRPCVVFTDTEYTPVQFALIVPLVSRIITPASFRKDLGRKHVRVDSYKELAYLHPNRFRPNPEVLRLLNMDPSERFVLLRFNSFDAVHDFGIRGFSIDEKRRLVASLKHHARVLISAEGELPSDLQDLQLNLPKSMIHDVLYFAALVVTDTGTIATEAAVLGTPVVRYSPIAGEDDLGNFIELERRYGLVSNCGDPKEAIGKAVSILKEHSDKSVWTKRRDRLLMDKMDLCDYLVAFLERWEQTRLGQ